MTQLTLYIYKPGVDFHLSELCQDIEPYRKYWAHPFIPLEENNESCYTVTRNPHDADFFILPYDLFTLTQTHRPLGTRTFMISLPHFSGREEKHVILDSHDSTSSYGIDCIIFKKGAKRSVSDPNTYGIWYTMRQHILQAKPDLDFSDIRYDVSFKGALTHSLRRKWLDNMRRAKGIRLNLQYEDTMDFHRTSYLHQTCPERKKAMEEAYIPSISQSYTVLCPRGCSNFSIRFYEAMYLARVPIILDDDLLLPDEDIIDYSSFCIRIPLESMEISHIFIPKLLQKIGPKHLMNMGKTARTIWEKHFSAKSFLNKILSTLAKVKEAGAISTAIAQREHELTTENQLVKLYSTDRYTGVMTENPKLWINKGFNMNPAPSDWPMFEANGVKGYLTDRDGDFLFKHAKKLPNNAVLVELGSFMGLSSIILANALIRMRNLNARIYCVDTWEGSKEHSNLTYIKDKTLFNIFQKNIADAAVKGFIHPIRQTSTAAARQFRDQSVDFLFIDADHSETAVQADLTNWYPKIRNGGIIMGHDCYEDNGVRRAVNAFAREQGVTYEVPDKLRFFIIRKP